MPKIIVTICLAYLLFLPACSFRPLYSSQNYGMTKTNIERVRLTTPDDINGYIIKSHLKSYIRPNKDSSHYQYDLKVEINSRGVDIAKSSAGVAARQQLIINAPYQLICLSNHAIIKSGTVTNTSSYDTSGTPFANTINDDQLRNKMMQEIAHDLYWQIIEVLENENPTCKNS